MGPGRREPDPRQPAVVRKQQEQGEAHGRRHHPQAQAPVVEAGLGEGGGACGRTPVTFRGKKLSNRKEKPFVAIRIKCHRLAASLPRVRVAGGPVLNDMKH